MRSSAETGSASPMRASASASAICWRASSAFPSCSNKRAIASRLPHGLHPVLQSARERSMALCRSPSVNSASPVFGRRPILAGAQPFGGGDVLQRALALVQLRIGMRQRAVDQRVVGRQTQRIVKGIDRLLVAALAILRIGESQWSLRSLGAYLTAATYSRSAGRNSRCWRYAVARARCVARTRPIPSRRIPPVRARSGFPLSPGHRSGPSCHGEVTRLFANQRRGRAGRLGPGLCVRFWESPSGCFAAGSRDPQVRSFGAGAGVCPLGGAGAAAAFLARCPLPSRVEPGVGDPPNARPRRGYRADCPGQDSGRSRAGPPAGRACHTRGCGEPGSAGGGMCRAPAGEGRLGAFRGP